MQNKVLFVHDGPLGLYEGSHYGVHYKNELIDRYKKLGDKQVTFLMRETILTQQDLNKFTLIDHPLFHFIKIPNFKSIKSYSEKYKAKQIIKKAVTEHDVIICRLPSAAGVIAFKEAKKQNKPILVEAVACVFDALWNYDWRGKLLAHYKYYKYKSIFKKASYVIYVTDKFLQKRYPTAGKSIGCSDVVLNSHDETKLTQRLDQIKSKEQNSTLQLTTVAALDVVYKGQADVIQALYKLKQKGNYFKFKIIGQGNPTRLQNLIDEFELNDLVEIVGPLPHNEVFNELEQTDIYIQPSKQEGLPRAVIEAMSLGCPVIGSDTGGIPELIQPECVYPKGNISQLIQKLTTVNNDFLLKQAKVNFEKSKHYESSFLEEKRIDFYDEFLKDYNLV
jgi:glycosyltransferase involved in cell wall biosynthesis